MHHVRGLPVKAGFIHVPFLPEQTAACLAPAPSMTLDEIVAGLRVAVEVALAVETDVVLAGGATH
jgi:pyroglutamyl-peptidase